MFTGIVRGLAEVVSVQANPSELHYTIAMSNEWCGGLSVGASISIDGVCQTVVAFSNVEDKTHIEFDAIGETLKITTLSELKVSQLVNVERAAAVGDEIGGHLMSGHIDGVVTVDEVIAPESGGKELWLLVDQSMMPYLFDKGFVGLNGCSLTIHGVDEAKSRFRVCLIPETLRITSFDTVQTGEHLNVEIDRQTQAIVNTVERVLSRRLSEQ